MHGHGYLIQSFGISPSFSARGIPFVTVVNRALSQGFPLNSSSRGHPKWILRFQSKQAAITMTETACPDSPD